MWSVAALPLRGRAGPQRAVDHAAAALCTLRAPLMDIVHVLRPCALARVLRRRARQHARHLQRVGGPHGIRSPRTSVLLLLP